MRAYILKRYGGPDGSLLTDVPAPAPGPRDILVDVRASGLNPVDFKFREGKLRTILRPRLPLVLGNELAGEVVAVGSAVERFRVGDRVFARVAKDRAGAFAEQACVDEDYAALMPKNLDFTAAAAVPLAGLTALQALRDILGVKPGQSVFISGGAGGVGTFAIQIAKWLGAHVTTTASKRGEALVRSLGCDEVIDYTVRDVSSVEGRFDAGFDLIGGKTLDQMFEIMKPGATIVSVAAMPEPQTALNDLRRGRALAALFWLISLGVRSRARRAGVSYRYLFMHPSGSDLSLLAELIEQGKLTVIVDRTYPFAEIAEALDYVEGGRAQGKSGCHDAMSDGPPAPDIGIFDAQRLRYHLILARPTPPPSTGKALIMRGYPITEPTVRASRIRRGCENGSHQEVFR
ncbi:NADP-dependent oxidoreductase [Mesorhizobium sp. PAMC28654]|uniref:NADP-dependent oxidoreductase n=1 Tax=Mesorhizobium sp. PAMC28654 TaxID=2880934 RepID=UPI001D0B969F|nr:NADP-dependent oxidoreductase [Mesorhizobium sp. PAMC28654]UDL88889.1 NADP-dependent oxidoreductase [Mesorhizobium sp. PAMC28654]